jgi:hypothetical protein
MTKENKMTCELCEQLRDPSNFVAGAHVKIYERDDCDKCEVSRSQPISDNGVIMELYALLPSTYDAWSGFKVFHFSDVLAMFKMFEVHEELQDDYYLRLMYFHEQLMEAKNKREKDKKKSNDKTDEHKKLASLTS